MTEVASCWRSLSPLLDAMYTTAGSSEDTWRKIDWIESCHLALLHHFPYAKDYILQLAEVYMRLVAVTKEEAEMCRSADASGIGTNLGGVPWKAITPSSLLMNSPVVHSPRQQHYDAKLNELFRTHLGVDPDGSPAVHTHDGTTLDAMCATTPEGAKTVLPGMIHSVDLWMLYIKKRNWDAAHSVVKEFPIPPPPVGYTPNITQVSVLLQRYEESLRGVYRSRKDKIWEGTEKGFEAALDGGAGFMSDNHLIWRQYVIFVRSMTDPVDFSGVRNALVPLPPPDPGHEHAIHQKQLPLLRSIYQRGITHPQLGLDQYWQ
jgi:hypothetical protein